MDKIFEVFFDGVLQSQKTHGLLLASVIADVIVLFLRPKIAGKIGLFFRTIKYFGI